MRAWFGVALRSAQREFQAQRSILWVVLLVAVLAAVAFASAAPVLWEGPLSPRVILTVATLVIGLWTVARGLLCRKAGDALDRRLPGMNSAVFGGKFLFLLGIAVASIILGVALGQGAAWALPANRLSRFGSQMLGITVLLCCQALICTLWIVLAGLWFRSSKLALLGAAVLCGLFVLPGLYVWNSSPGFWPRSWEVSTGLCFLTVLPVLLSWASWKWMLRSWDRQAWKVGVPLFLLFTTPVAGWATHRVSQWWEVRADQANVSIFSAHADVLGNHLFITLMRQPETTEGGRRVWWRRNPHEKLPSCALTIDLHNGKVRTHAQRAVWSDKAVLNTPLQYPVRFSPNDGIAKDRIVLWHAEGPNRLQLFDASSLEELELPNPVEADPTSEDCDLSKVQARSEEMHTARTAARHQLIDSGLMTDNEIVCAVFKTGECLIVRPDDRIESGPTLSLRLQKLGQKGAQALKVITPHPLKGLVLFNPHWWRGEYFQRSLNCYIFKVRTDSGTAWAKVDLDRSEAAFTQAIPTNYTGLDQLVDVSEDSLVMISAATKILRVHFGAKGVQTLFETAATSP